MSGTIASIWRSVPADIALRLERCLARACDQAGSKTPVPIFFRADDIAMPGKQFVRLVELFKRYRMPLCLAVVPAWLSRLRWQQCRKIAGSMPELWCWHQHGWRHANHEKKGKKQEFGPARPLSAIIADISRGRRRLQSLLDKDFYAVFTPPWNRCSLETLQTLAATGYRAVSRIQGSLPLSPDELPDLQINLDLHTRRELKSADGWRPLLADLKQGIRSGRCGIMIHHRLMNDAAFDFLELLLKIIAAQKGLQPANFKELIEF
jgi:peptidoglycan/xylan/chitin deacetylase (PgdA/CDA1 family)